MLPRRRGALDHDFVIHDPQPLPMVNHYRKSGPWIWRCHTDLTNPNRGLRNYLVIRLLEQYLDLFNSFETVYRLKRSPDELSRSSS